MSAVTDAQLTNLIATDPYIQKCKSNKKKDVCSLSSLVDPAVITLSQSDCITPLKI